VSAVFGLFPASGDHRPAKPEFAAALRADVRGFIAEERARGTIRTGKQSWTTYDRAFSERCLITPQSELTIQRKIFTMPVWISTSTMQACAAFDHTTGGGAWR
jgi:hypothetical protein